ncbi:MAG: bifunctional nuclease family protein [Parachlamydiales bacterium]|jgi:bifunctional DNase/RNase|nr:bifunctional nuclease family protein [Verrucomicrobiota bacterium]MBX3720116.1 bifunctional nuclease family protein [Candidatus Acheromyda pituitae]
MASELVPITFNKIMQSRSYTVIILGTAEKRFAIYTDPQVGRNIQTFLTTEHKPRPYTHDLMNSIFRGLDIKPLQIVITDIEDTIYFARLFLEQTTGEQKTILEIDARPSDCITLALMDNIPVYCRKEILEKAVAVQE